MSNADAVAFLEKTERDETFAAELQSVKADPAAVQATVRGAGFDATPDEIREAFIDRYGAELTPQQLDAVAAGMDPTAAAVGGTIGIVAALAISAAAAAA